MTNENISLMLERLNSGSDDGIIITPIAENVYWGFAWGLIDHAHTGADPMSEEREFFFVKDADGQFAAAVFRMDVCNLHWFVREQNRRKGILLNPLKAVILPFILARYPKRTMQECTVDLELPCAQQSLRIAEKVGFKKTEQVNSEVFFVLNPDAVKKLDPRPRAEAPPEALEKMERQLYDNLRSVGVTLDTIRVKYADHFSHQISDLADNAFYSLAEIRRELHDTLRYECHRDSKNQREQQSIRPKPPC